jgi:AraC-like DNA-binding protein
MQKYIDHARINHTDLNIYGCGYEDCPPGYSSPQFLREYYIIHYIHSGKGTFQIGGNTYPLGKGHGFLITPSTYVDYYPDSEDPWSYSWVCFHGLKAEYYLNLINLSIKNPIFKYNKDNFIKDCFEQIISLGGLDTAGEIEQLGHLYIFFAKLIRFTGIEKINKEKNNKEQYVKKVIGYLHANYSKKINIAELAQHIGLDKNYLCTLFKEYYHITIVEFLTHLRISKACELLQDKMLSIEEIAHSVGFKDPLYFSRVFRKLRKGSPRQYRKTYKYVLLD